jgi:hypothetical protein
VLPTLRKDLTATAAQTRSAGIRDAKEGPRSGLRASMPASYLWPAVSTNFGGICRMPSVPLTLDPSHQQEEGRP